MILSFPLYSSLSFPSFRLFFFLLYISSFIISPTIHRFHLSLFLSTVPSFFPILSPASSLEFLPAASNKRENTAGFSGIRTRVPLSPRNNLLLPLFLFLPHPAPSTSLFSPRTDWPTTSKVRRSWETGARVDRPRPRIDRSRCARGTAITLARPEDPPVNPIERRLRF